MNVPEELDPRRTHLPEKVVPGPKVARLLEIFQHARKDIIRNVHGHPTLHIFLEKLFADSPTLSISSATIRYVALCLEAGTSVNRKFLYQLSDVRIATYFEHVEEDVRPLQSYPYENDVRGVFPPKQLIGDIELSFCIDETRRSCMLITNGQCTKNFWSLPSSLKKKYGKWYHRSVCNFSDIAKSAAGVKRVLIPSGALVAQTVKANFENHHVPESCLDRFYDGYAKKYGGVLTNCNVSHPISGASLEGEMYEMPVS